MRISVTLLDPLYDSHRDVIVECDDSTPAQAVTRALIELLGSPDVSDSGNGHVVSLTGRRHRVTAGAPTQLLAVPVFIDGVTVDLTSTWADSGVHEGSLITVGQAVSLSEPVGPLEARVVTGPGSGAVHRLVPGEATIGSDPSCVIAIQDDRVPPIAAVLSVAADVSATVRAIADASSVLAETFPGVESTLALDRVDLTGEPVAWPLGSQLTIGQTRLELEWASEADAAIEVSPDPGWLDYNRPPRLLPPARETKFRLPTAPRPQRHQAIPWLVTLAPMVMAVAMVVVMDSWRYLLMGLMSPLMMMGNYFQSKKSGKRDYKQELAAYKQKKEGVEADAEQAVIDERQARRNEAPDPALTLLIATGPRGRLWERRPSDPDYLSVRLGVGDLPSEVTVEDPDELEHRRRTIRTAYDVPIVLPLRERGVVAIAGPAGFAVQLGAWAVAQLAVLQSPRDTHIYLLTDHEGLPAWDWLRWLPHVRPLAGQNAVATIGSDTDTCARRVAELTAILAARQVASGGRPAAPGSQPDIVVVFDGARRLRVLPGVVALLKQGPAVGIYSLCLDSDERLLPAEASAVVVHGERGLTLRQMRVTVVEEVTPDLVDAPWLHRVSRSLAPLRDISDGESDSVLPSTCRLTEVMGLEPLSPAGIKARWALSPRSTAAVVGVSMDGPFAIDLRRDGPHGLIAGTTGAGKSELLQTIVASLAVANRPDGMTFVLVDYKGGAAFKDCVDLPHTVGMVTDLDTHLVERALISLGAELNRREHILADAGAKDIEDYLDIADKRGGMAPLPRLLIVIDEFASMARELPDFITGLVNIAQRGRSLGIHLILATQRPGGVVSPEIRANTNLRIALRVTDASESSDVIGSPESARIAKNQPGRAFVRLGANSLVPFQSGRVGGRRPGSAATAASTPWVTHLRLEDLAQPAPLRPQAQVVDDAEVTDLKVLVDAIRLATNELHLPAQHSPWLDALDTELLLDSLLTPAPSAAYPTLPAFPFGVEDLPAQQARRPACIDFATFSHLAIMGGPRSGRSQALRAMAASVASLASPADVHLYGLDCGNGALLPMVELPHCGAVVQRTQTDRATRLLTRLTQELARRQDLLGQGGYASLGEYRAATPSDHRLPHLLVFIDRWEAFMSSLHELDNGALTERVYTLLREGASVGIHLVIAGDRSVASPRLSSIIENKISLRLPDKSDFTMVGLNPRKMPDEIPDGRGFRSETGIELQFALLDANPAGPAQAAALRTIAAHAKVRYGDVDRALLPFRLDVLPASVAFEQAWDLRADPQPRPLWAMLGVGGDDLTAYALDLSYLNAAIVAGPPKTGRSTALVCIVESLLRNQTDVVLATPRPSPLRQLAGRSGVRAVLTGVDLDEETLAPLMDPTQGPVVLVIDDGELLKDIPGRDYLKKIVRTGADVGQAIVLGGDSGEVASGFTGWQLDLKGRCGLLLSPQGFTDGELIGARIPRSSVTASGPAGRAMAHTGDARLVTIQVPSPPAP